MVLLIWASDSSSLLLGLFSTCPSNFSTIAMMSLSDRLISSKPLIYICKILCLSALKIEHHFNFSRLLLNSLFILTDRADLQMIEKLENLSVRIPYTTLFRSERYVLRNLHKSLNGEQNYIGEAKMSNRMTVVILSYMAALMQQSRKNKIYYICESQARVQELRKTLTTLREYLKKSQNSSRSHEKFTNGTIEEEVLSDRQPNSFYLERSQIVILNQFFHKEHDLLKDYPQDRYISIMSSRDYFQEMVQLKVKKANVWVKANYLFLQTSAYDEIIENSISGWINQIVIRRAYIEHRKLHRFYHDKKGVVQKPKEENNQMEVQNQLPRRSSSSSLKRKSGSVLQNSSRTSLDSKGQTRIHHGSHEKTKQLKIKEVDKKFREVFSKKVEQLLLSNQKGSAKQRKVYQPNYNVEQEGILMLTVAGYLINFLQFYQRQISKEFFRQNINSKERDNIGSFCSSAEFINHLEKSLLLKDTEIQKIYVCIKKLLQAHPPIINPKNYDESSVFIQNRQPSKPYTLSTQYILHLTKFFKNLIEQHRTFDQKYNKCISVGRYLKRASSQQPFVFEINFKCLDQLILSELIMSFNENSAVLMNNGMSFEFYQAIFKPKSLFVKTETSDNDGENEEKSFKLLFDSPTEVFDHCLTNIYGLNVAVTPSQEDLKIPENYKDGTQQSLEIIKAYGVFLYDLCETVSDGILVFFPSLAIMSEFRQEWQSKEDIYAKISQTKVVFEESEYETENIQQIAKYKKLCDMGRGAVFFASASGEMIKYSKFPLSYSRTCLFVGFPQCQEIKQKENHHRIKQSELEILYGLKIAAKCLSHCITSNIEPKSVIFADVAFNRQSTKKWFPFIRQGNLNTLDAIDKIKKYHQQSELIFGEGLAWETGKVESKAGLTMSKIDHLRPGENPYKTQQNSRF